MYDTFQQFILLVCEIDRIIIHNLMLNYTCEKTQTEYVTGERCKKYVINYYFAMTKAMSCSD